VRVRVLGIESSCDETAAAVVGPEGVISDVVHTQQVHGTFGGVVPELAARAHAELLPGIVRESLRRAGLDRPDAVVATAGPGLIGAVLVGVCFAKAAAAAWGVPFLPVNHLEGHLLSPLLEDPPPRWPFLCLVVSGGHTTLYLAHRLGVYEVLAETIDDAAGEAYDKVARMLGLGFPGGPIVDRLAATGNPLALAFPRSAPGPFNWSFSGLKTAVRTALARSDRPSDADVCASFQAAVVDVLVDRVVRVAAQRGIRSVAVAGGVAANAALRARLQATGLDVVLPPKSRCTDNGAMIAHAGRLHLLAGARVGLDAPARPDWAPGTPLELP
jgi:N6-L-threonylcarbamoyladenine synthase